MEFNPVITVIPATKDEYTLRPLGCKVKLHVAAYARVSSGKDEMLHSLAAQVDYYRDMIQNHPEWTYCGVYADEALTGTKSSRPEFQRLLADCRAGNIDLVLTKSISRFARNTVTLLETVRELKALSIDLYFEEQNIHTLSADGELLLTILAAYAQEESLSVSENCKWRIRKNFREGIRWGHIRMFGYVLKDGKLTIIPKEAEAVRMIFADYLGGMGKAAIAKKLTRLGVPAKNGCIWNENSVVGILDNEKYIGDMCLQKFYTVDSVTKLQKVNRGTLPKFYVEGTHEAIIDKATFDAVQAERAKRAAKGVHPAAPASAEFKGMIRCGRCGARFRKSVNGAGTKYAKVTWACVTYINRGKDQCPAKRIPESILKEKCAEVLDLAEYDAEIFLKKVSAIFVPDDGVLTFTFKDGTERTITWEHRSRRESWTDEMKAAAREKAKGESECQT